MFSALQVVGQVGIPKVSPFAPEKPQNTPLDFGRALSSSGWGSKTLFKF